MENLILILQNDFIIVGLGLGAVLCLGLANTLLGVVKAGISSFDWKVLFKGLVRLLVMIISLALFILGVELLTYGIGINGTELENVVTILELVYILYKGANHYGKDFLVKLNELFPAE